MKSSILVAFILLACVCLQVNAGCKHGEKVLPEGTSYTDGTTGECLSINCSEDGSKSILGCAESRCSEGKQIGYNAQDNTKPYPDCCPSPICKE